MKAAICDDEVQFQLFLREKLESYYGMLEVEIEVFSSGISFLEKFKEHPYEYQLIFMDIEMPGIDGIETSRLIRDKAACLKYKCPLLKDRRRALCAHSTK